ncbi:MAG: RluA family pseudouridine synthase [Planctomycetota bacterium]
MPRQQPIPILYRDDHLLVVHKPSRQLVVPAPGRSGRTVVDEVTAQLGHRVFAVHRLDEDVTGVLVLANCEAAREPLEQVFRGHQAERLYLALLSRAPSPPAGRIESRLREESSGLVRSVAGGPGTDAITEYRTLKRVDHHTLVECRLLTGRRNQIRVHMADLGCPIVGDRKYGFRSRGRASFKRPLLHAYTVKFRHPITGAEVFVQAEPAEKELMP